MKIIKFLYKPIKYLLLLSLFCALIYFRSIIFQPEINKYIDGAITYIENEFDIQIPEHIAEQKKETLAIANTTSQPVTEVASNESVIEKPIEDYKPVSPVETVEMTESEHSMPEKTSSVIEEIQEKQATIIEKLSATVDMINQKVDKLFNNSNTTVSTQQAPVNNQEITTPPAETIVSQTYSIPNNNMSSDTSQMLTRARQSFWNGNAQLSEKLYLELIHHQETDPDIYGELGNVYYTQGKWKQAGEAYYEAAIRLLELNQNDQVHYLLRVIQGLDTASAERLKQKISG